MEPQEWLASFADRLGLDELSQSDIDTLLEIASIAAHTSERLAAPLPCYLIGRAGIAPIEAKAIAEEIAATRAVGGGLPEERGNHFFGGTTDCRAVRGLDDRTLQEFRMFEKQGDDRRRGRVVLRIQLKFLEAIVFAYEIGHGVVEFSDNSLEIGPGRWRLQVQQRLYINTRRGKGVIDLPRRRTLRIVEEGVGRHRAMLGRGVQFG